MTQAEMKQAETEQAEMNENEGVQTEMNQQILKGKWHQMKGAVKENWGELTDDDMKVLLGKGEQLAGRLQERYGYSQAQAEREVAEFMDSFNDGSPLPEIREKTAEVVREHPWFTSIFFGAIALLLTGYFVNRFTPMTESAAEKMKQ